ncbi:MAG TPA: DUF2784 domain-containing protein [Planctomycetaceae bacterium]|nr:DUF2784 domain-containing protein [Planctomycetaceae bacterium]
MATLYRTLADVVVVLHAGYVLFVVIGLLVILIGLARGWRSVRNPWFRWIHLAMIGIVVVEALLSFTCPLTTLEDWLRAKAGQNIRSGSFIGRIAHDLIFWNAPPWVFTVSYCLFGVAVLLTFWLAPPRVFRPVKR